MYSLSWMRVDASCLLKSLLNILLYILFCSLIDNFVDFNIVFANGAFNNSTIFNDSTRKRNFKRYGGLMKKVTTRTLLDTKLLK